jgi:hypothetical protein
VKVRYEEDRKSDHLKSPTSSQENRKRREEKSQGNENKEWRKRKGPKEIPGNNALAIVPLPAERNKAGAKQKSHLRTKRPRASD